MFEAVRRRAQASHPQLVVRGIGTAAECTFSVADADLVRACPAPLLLTRGRPWRAHPTVAAALDVSGEEPPQLIHRVLLAAADIARRCGASVELLFAQRETAAALTPPPQAQLASHAAAAGVKPAAMHVLSGEPAQAIAEFARRREYEILVLGALAHRHAQVGSLTAHLLEALDCDLLLVRPAPPGGRSVTRHGRRGDELCAARAARHRASELARLDDEDVAVEPIEHAFGGIADQQPLQPRACHGAHHHDVGAGVIGDMLDHVHRESGDDVTARARDAQQVQLRLEFRVCPLGGLALHPARRHARGGACGLQLRAAAG